MTWSVLQGHLVAKALSLAFSWAGTYGPSLVSNLASKAGSSHAAVRARVTNMLQRMDESRRARGAPASAGNEVSELGFRTQAGGFLEPFHR